VVPISREFDVFLKEFVKLDLGCPIVLDSGKPFVLAGMNSDEILAQAQAATKSPAAT
jgi:hypothetical protein